jgi:hypothetical protein
MRNVQLLKEDSVDEFRKRAFHPAIPVVFPQGHFSNLTGLKRWFVLVELSHTVELNRDYLQAFGEATVPLELTQSLGQDVHDTFQRFNASLSAFSLSLSLSLGQYWETFPVPASILRKHH